MAVTLYKRNALTLPGVVLKNGTGGSAPDLDQNPDWPMRYALSPDRYLYWRAQAGGLGPHLGVYQFDFDFGSAVNIGAAGFLMARHYPPDIVFTQWNAEAYYGSSYPPANAVSLALGIANDDNLKAFGPISARYWRLEINAIDPDSNPVEISGKPWLVLQDDIVAMGNPSQGSQVANRYALREQRSPAGAVFRFAPGIQRRALESRRLSLSVPADDGTILAITRDVMGATSERFVVQDWEGFFLEASLPEGEARYARRFVGLYDSSYELESVP